MATADNDAVRGQKRPRWRELLLSSIENLCEASERNEFTLTELLAATAEDRRALFPANMTSDATIRKELQNLRDSGQLEFLGNGEYRFSGQNPSFGTGVQDRASTHKLLMEFAALADHWLAAHPNVEKHYHFMNEFFTEDNLQSIEWEDIQQIGDNLHCFAGNALARSRAFGKHQNYPIQAYRDTFMRLSDKSRPVEERFREFFEREGSANKYVGKSAISEILGNLHADTMLFRNIVDIEAAKFLGVSPKYPKGSDDAEKFVLFNEAMKPLMEELRGMLPDAVTQPIGLVLDQFFYWLKTAKQMTGSAAPSEIGSSNRIWIFSAGEDARWWDSQKQAGIAALGWPLLGDLSRYEDFEDFKKQYRLSYPADSKTSTKPRALWRWREEVQIGDILIARKGKSRVVGIGRVTGELEWDGSRKEDPQARNVDWLKTGEWQVPSHLRQFTPMTLVKVGRDSHHLEMIHELLGIDLEELLQGNFDSIDSMETSPPSSLPYSIADIEDSFTDRNDLERFFARWQDKRNLILTGPPGVGKSFISSRLADAMAGFRNSPRVRRVQFHQSTSYEDFVGGYKPTEDGRFKLSEGIFFRLCKEAARAEDDPFVLIIDEINRGNLSRIFGELLYLIEADKRGPDFALALSTQPLELDHESSEEDSESNPVPTWQNFFVPENLYILGMMNTADRSLALVDYALRRRFAFFDLTPKFASSKFAQALASAGLGQTQISGLTKALDALNAKIEKDQMLGKGFAIGHSYFCPPYDRETDEYEKIANPSDWLEGIVESEIAPLLEEYWFGEQASKASEAITQLRSDLGLSIKSKVDGE
ncbi:MAG: AAA family ATPase [Planctomycetes bacterium]|nr:AAA family ATPase [Planctomycetota bacterium]